MCKKRSAIIFKKDFGPDPPLILGDVFVYLALQKPLDIFLFLTQTHRVNLYYG
jgi:hypothetical protein